MARIDWVLLCEHAYFDRQGRLGVVGIVRDLPASRLPSTLQRVMLVARLSDLTSADDVDVCVGMVTPSGYHEARKGSKGVRIDMRGEYIIATLRDIPLTESGLHHFQVQLRGQPVVAVEIPVVPAFDRMHLSRHAH